MYVDPTIIPHEQKAKRKEDMKVASTKRPARDGAPSDAVVNDGNV